VAIPKLRSGSYFPDWLLERRRRAERALTTVVATCYLLGVSTRRMEKLVETLGITRLSKSQVSVMARELDEHFASFHSRPLDAGPYTFVTVDALVLKVREGGRVVPVRAIVATGVNADGHQVSARARERYRLAPTKPDAFEAFVLADSLRHEHRHWRPLAVPSPLLAELRALTRDRERLIWNQRDVENQLRLPFSAAFRVVSTLNRTTAAFLPALFGGLDRFGVCRADWAAGPRWTSRSADSADLMGRGPPSPP